MKGIVGVIEMKAPDNVDQEMSRNYDKDAKSDQDKMDDETKILNIEEKNEANLVFGGPDNTAGVYIFLWRINIPKCHVGKRKLLKGD